MGLLRRVRRVLLWLLGRSLLVLSLLVLVLWCLLPLVLVLPLLLPLQPDMMYDRREDTSQQSAFTSAWHLEHTEACP